MPEEYKKLNTFDFKCPDYMEYKKFSKLIRKYARQYSEYISEENLQLIPINLRPNLKIDTNSVDNIDILTYVSNLINTSF